MTGVRDRGMVTAELAVAVPVVLVVLALGLSAIRLGIDEVRCVDAARLAARALARGDSEGSARALAVTAGPPGASVVVGSTGAEVSATVSASRDLAGWRMLIVRGSATAAKERVEEPP
ncbi:MAG TPA: TadE family type IV pilus minor pilin [Lapillicoccus sp.]|nr:TadE family type IV pilus minor pilin [Lapillicoccus sp.]